MFWQDNRGKWIGNEWKIVAAYFRVFLRDTPGEMEKIILQNPVVTMPTTRLKLKDSTFMYFVWISETAIISLYSIS
jgi:hypothetical protein